MRKLPPRTVLAAALSVALGAAFTSAADAANIIAAQPSVASIDAAAGNPSLLVLRTGIFDPAHQQLDVAPVGAASARPSAYAIVQFQPGRTGDRTALERQGVQFLGYVPNNAYYVRLGKTGLAALRSDPSVHWAGTFEPAMKLDPALWTAHRATSAAKQANGRYEILVNAFSGVSSDRMAAALVKLVPGVVITLRSTRPDALPYVRASVDPAHLDALITAATAIEGAQFVTPWIQTVTTNAGAVGAIQGDATGACAGSGPICGPAPIWDHGIIGSGQIVASADSGTTPNAAWFATIDRGSGPHTAVTFSDNPPPVLPNVGNIYPDNKIIAYWLQPNGPVDYDYNSGHGTHTSGTLIGDAAGTFGANTYLASTPTEPNHDLADGMAPNAQFIEQDVGGTDSSAVYISDFQGTLEQAFSGGARIHSDSWGAPTSGAYTSDDHNLDTVAFNVEDMLVVVAAGNDQSGPMATGSPGNAKSALTVAALGHAGSLTKAGFSNSGPTADGRLKPEISAPGTSTVSARFGTNVDNTITAPQTATMSGTSMATPTVAGGATLLRQYFADGFYPRGDANAADDLNPTGAMMKAVLLNGTNPINSSGWPSTGTGYGREWLDGSLWFNTTMSGGNDDRRTRLFERTNSGGLQTGDVNTYTIANVAADQEFRVTLAWFDPEAAAGAAATLVNNLDLTVIGPGNQTYYGNHFTGGVSTTGGSPDAINTVEQVRFTAPAAGTYTLQVSGTSVPGNGRALTDRQGYALVASGDFGLPDQTPYPAPTSPTVASNDTDGIGIGFTAASGSEGFQLYRADGTCGSAATGDFHMVASGAASPLVDNTTQGGFGYAYKVRGIENDVEGEASTCVDAVSNDTCTLLPTFDQSTIAANGAQASCAVDLSWAAAQATCPDSTGVTYTITRSADPYFTDGGTIVAQGVTDTSYADTAVTDGTPYYYRVSAADSVGNSTPATRTLNVTPTGPDGPDPASFVDDVDTHTYMSMESPWQITNTAASDGTYSYHNAADGQPYKDMQCASITMPPLAIQSGASMLDFMAEYDLEYQWDGVVIELSTDGGATWNDLPPVGGYPNTFAQTQDPPVNACGFPASHGAFTGVSTVNSDSDPGNGTATAVFKPFQVDLTPYVGQTVQVRWRFSSDPASGFAGFYLDQVTLGEGLPGDVIFANGFDSAPSGDYQCH